MQLCHNYRRNTGNSSFWEAFKYYFGQQGAFESKSLRTTDLGDTIELLKRMHSWFLFPVGAVGLDEFRFMLGIPFCSPRVCLSLLLLAQLNDSILAKHPSISPTETREEGRMGRRDRADRREESFGKAAWEQKQVRDKITAKRWANEWEKERES